MSYNYTNGDGLSALDASKPDGSTEPVSILDDAIRQIVAYLKDPIAGPKGLIDSLGTSLMPTGTILTSAVNAVPSGWLSCDGSAVSRTTYAALFAAIGVTYGAGDSVTTFNVPDLRGRVPVGIGTGDAVDATAWSLGGKLGAETCQLTAAQNGAHSHSVFADESSTSAPPLAADKAVARFRDGIGDTSYSIGNATLSATVGQSSSSGTGAAHNNLQPSIGLRFIIKT